MCDIISCSCWVEPEEPAIREAHDGEHSEEEPREEKKPFSVPFCAGERINAEDADEHVDRVPQGIRVGLREILQEESSDAGEQHDGAENFDGEC